MKSHQLDDWPFDESHLSAAEQEKLQHAREQSPELQKDLNVWQAIESSLQSEPLVGPEKGFTSRWRARLTEDRAGRHRRQVNGLLGALLTGATAAMLLIGFETLSSPAQLGAAGIEAIIRVGQMLDAGARYLTILGNGWIAFVSALALSATLAWVSVLWIAAMYRYAFRQIQNGV